MIRQDEVFKIGRIGKTHGIKGELVFSFDDDIFDQVDADYLILEVDGILVPFFLEEYRFKNDDTALVKFCDIDTQEQAKSLVGAAVYFEHRLASAGDSMPTWAQIVGFQIVDASSQQVVGKLLHVDTQTDNRLFELETAGKTTLLLPASDELITDISIEQRTITMIIPDGIFDL